MDLALNNLLWLICYKTKLDQTIQVFLRYIYKLNINALLLLPAKICAIKAQVF